MPVASTLEMTAKQAARSHQTASDKVRYYSEPPKYTEEHRYLQITLLLYYSKNHLFRRLHLHRGSEGPGK